MKKSTITMGMKATVVIVDSSAKHEDIEDIFIYLQHIDDVFSTYKNTSEISQINSGALPVAKASQEVREVLYFCDDARKQTNGYFDIHRNGNIDPSGYVKGYAIHQAAEKLQAMKYANFFVEIAGDIEVSGMSEHNAMWQVGIENPFVKGEIVKVVNLTNCGIATSGNYKQGQHIYNPIAKRDADEIASVSIIADTAEKADMFATACFAMGEKGIIFLEKQEGVEGYMITKDKKAIYTSGFEKFVLQ